MLLIHRGLATLKPKAMKDSTAEAISDLEQALADAGTVTDRASVLNKLAPRVAQWDLSRAIEVVEQTLRSASLDANESLAPVEVAEICVTLSQLLIGAARYEPACNLASRALSLFESHDRAEGQLRSMSVSIRAHLGMGRYPPALEQGLTQLDLANALGTRPARIDALNGIGLVYAALGDHGVALAHHKDALEMSCVDGDIAKQQIAATNCCVDACHLGEFEEAIEYGLQGLHLAGRAENAREGILASLGEAYTALEHYAEAERCLDESLQLAIHSGRIPVRVQALCSLAELGCKRDRYEDVLPLLNEAVELASTTAARPALVRCHHALYRANKSLGKFEPALRHYEFHSALKTELLGEQMNTRLRDLEVRHHTESAIKEAALVQDQITELEHLNYAISHDLKGPLLTIRAFADLLDQDLAVNDTKKVAGDLNWIRSAATTMQKRVTELVKLSQIRRRPASFVAVDMNELIKEVIDSLGGPISEKGSLIEVESDLPTVVGDPDTLGHLFQNLLENALKFGGDSVGPRIEVGTRRKLGRTTFFIKDDGFGIEPQYHETVFRLFERLDPDVDGSGVGLALVKRIVENHGGRVWLESVPGKWLYRMFRDTRGPVVRRSGSSPSR